MTVCKNCNHTFEGKFCPECGQKAKTGRITIRQVIKYIRDHFIHFDQGFLYTIKELLLRPGHTIREYLEGRRVQHIKPLKFMFWATAISFLFTHYAGLQERLLQRIESQSAVQGKSTHLGQKISDFIYGHPSLMILFILPGIAFCSWLFFRKSRYNYAEHFTANAFLMGELSLLSIVTSAVYLLFGDISLTQITIIGSLQWCLWTVYYGWAYGQVFYQEKKIRAWLKGIASLFVGYLVMIIFITILISTLIALFKPQIDAWLNN